MISRSRHTFHYEYLKGMRPLKENENDIMIYNLKENGFRKTNIQKILVSKKLVYMHITIFKRKLTMEVLMVINKCIMF